VRRIREREEAPSAGEVGAGRGHHDGACVGDRLRR
jgi:hypothetical protein